MSDGNAPASNGPTQTMAWWAVVVGIAGWPLALVIWMVARGLEEYRYYSLRDAAVMTGWTLIVLALFALLLGLAALRRWMAVVGVAVLFGAVILYLLMLPPEHVISNESAAVANLRTINTAQFTYQSSEGMGRFGTMPDLIAARLIDPGFGAIRSGYILKVSVASDGKGYTATAGPATNKNGKYAYYSTAEAVVRYTAEYVDTCDPCFPKGQAGQPVH